MTAECGSVPEPVDERAVDACDASPAVTLTTDVSAQRCAGNYTLTRTWDATRPPWVFVMLNPSTADQFVNDPTVARCQARARRGGAGGVIVVNLFALRSTDPKALYAANDPIGPENDDAIAQACRGAATVICAWGKHGALARRGNGVRTLLASLGVMPYVLALNRDGSPKHPLYVANAAPLQPWPIAA